MTKSVRQPDARHASNETSWTLANDLLGGTWAMREAGTKYVHKNEAESQAAYDERLSMSFLYNVFENTVDTMAGKPFRKEVAINSAPQVFQDHANNIDLQGRDLTAFGLDLARQVIAKGITYIFVDHPAKPRNKDGSEMVLSRQQEKEIGLRPYWVHVRPENMLEVKYGFSGGALVIDRIRILETVEVDSDKEFKSTAIEQVRVVYPDRFEVWRADPKTKEWDIYEEGLRSVGVITLVPVYAKHSAPFRSKPPLQALMEKNLEHWQSGSAQNRLLHKARMFLLFGKQLDLTNTDGTPKKLSTDSLITSESDSGDLKVVEHSGAAITTGASALKVTTEEMETLGGMLLQADSTRTATESNSKDAKGDSRLHSIVVNIESAMELAAKYHMMTIGQKDVVDLTIFRDFSLFDPNFMSAEDLLKAVMSELITHEMWLKIMKQRGVDFGDTTPEQIAEAYQNKILDIPRTNEA